MTARVAAVLDKSVPSSPLSIPLSQTALLLLDFQNLTASLIGEAGKTSVVAAAQLRHWTLKNQVAVFHCVVDTGPDEKPDPHMKAALRWPMYQQMFAKDARLADELDELAPKESGEMVFRRQPGLVSALLSPGLRDTLEQKQIRSLILAGWSTSGCVLSTCRAASDQGFVVTVAEDACSDRTPGVHDTLAQHVLPMAAHVAKTQEMETAFAST